MYSFEILFISLDAWEASKFAHLPSGYLFVQTWVGRVGSFFLFPLLVYYPSLLLWTYAKVPHAPRIMIVLLLAIPITAIVILVYCAFIPSWSESGIATLTNQLVRGRDCDAVNLDTADIVGPGVCFHMDSA